MNSKRKTFYLILIVVFTMGIIRVETLTPILVILVLAITPVFLIKIIAPLHSDSKKKKYSLVIFSGFGFLAYATIMLKILKIYFLDSYARYQAQIRIVYLVLAIISAIVIIGGYMKFAEYNDSNEL